MIVKPYIVAGKSLSRKTNDELIQSIFNSNDENNVTSVVQEISRRNDQNTMAHASRIPAVIKSARAVQMIIAYLKNKTEQQKFEVLEILFKTPDVNYTGNAENDITSVVVTGGPYCKAIALISQHTPSKTTNSVLAETKICDINSFLYIGPQFNQSVITTQQNPVAVAIEKLLSSGYSWENCITGSLIMERRLASNRRDAFCIMMSKYDMHPALIKTVYGIVDRGISVTNSEVKKQLDSNQRRGFVEYRMLSNIYSLWDDLETHIKDMLGVIEKSKNEQELFRLFDAFEFVINSRPRSFGEILNFKYNNKNVLVEFSKHSRTLCVKCLNMLKRMENEIKNKSSETIGELIGIGLYTYNIKEILTSLPEEMFKYVKLTPNDRSVVENTYEDEDEDETQRWSSTQINLITKDASFGSSLRNWFSSGALLAALSLLIHGEDIEDVIRKTNVPRDEIERALQTPPLVDAAKSFEFNIPNIESLRDKDKQIQNEKKEKEEKQKQTAENQKIINIIARTIYSEAKGEGDAGQRAVASVIYNRGNGNAYQIVREIKQPLQFSCWNDTNWKKFTIKEYSGSIWKNCKRIAEEIVNGTFKPTTTANHYFNPYKVNPSWAYEDGSKRTKLRQYKQIGNHWFMEI